MKLFEGLETIPAPMPESTIAIGTFDGVHVGHQKIIQVAVQDAHTHGRAALVFTFDRHPAELLAPQHAPPYLTTPAQRNRLIAECGADALVVARFDTALSQLSHEAFVRDILKAKLGAKAIVEGTNFFFGKGRGGNVEYLRSVQEKFEFTLHALNPVELDGIPVSSSRIRDRIREGDIAAAERLLGHAFLLAGRVVAGQKLGRSIGFPTANLERLDNQIVPADGIYAALATLDDGRTFGAACSIGDRPTIEGAGRSIEAYLFDFEEDIYGRQMELRFLRRLRAEEKFDSLSELQAQMARDVEQAREIITAVS